jgi:hypothetical protein
MDLEKSYDLTILVNDTERMVLEELGRRLDSAEEEGVCAVRIVWSTWQPWP